MSGLATASFNTPAQTPFVVAWDPGGTRYGSFAVLDPVNGTTTASAAQVQSTLALARGVAAASKPRDVATAMQAGYLANRGLSAANGQASQTRALDGLTIVVPSGTSQIGSTAITYGSGTYEAWLEIVGDPADSNPRANCLLQGPSVSTVSRVTRARFANMAIELDTVGVFDSVLYYWLDNVEVRGKSGKETTASCISTTTGALFYTRSRVWKTLRGMTYQSFHRPFLLRACEGSRRMEAMAVLGCTFLSNAVDTYAPAAGTGGEIYGTGGWGNQITGNGDLGSQEDVIIANCDLRNQTVRVWRPAKLLAATAGTVNNSYRRQVFANNLCERVSAGAGRPNRSGPAARTSRRRSATTSSRATASSASVATFFTPIRYRRRWRRPTVSSTRPSATALPTTSATGWRPSTTRSSTTSPRVCVAARPTAIARR